MLLVEARLEDVVDLEHDEPELSVGEEMRGRDEACQARKRRAGGREGHDPRNERAEHLVFEWCERGLRRRV
jgi:hypothetical protein